MGTETYNFVSKLPSFFGMECTLSVEAVEITSVAYCFQKTTNMDHSFVNKRLYMGIVYL